MYKNGLKKALTFSFDDGVIDDIRLVELLNKYGLKSTFNLNSGMLSNRRVKWVFRDVKSVRSLYYSEAPDLYNGHEIASHTINHVEPCEVEPIAFYNEMLLDKVYLEALYKTEIKGMAFPYGGYNDEVVELVKKIGHLYARTTKSTYSFEFPSELPLLHPTCRFNDARLFELADEFINSNPKEKTVFYVWGHSFEFITEEDWIRFEEFCKKISGKDDIYYCTNSQLFE